MTGRDSPWVGPGRVDFFAGAIGAWHEGMRGSVDDLLEGGPNVFFNLVALPPPQGLEDQEVVALASTLVARCLAEDFPPREVVAEVGAALREAAARSEGRRRFERPGYLARDRSLLIVLLFACVAAGGRGAAEGEP